MIDLTFIIEVELFGSSCVCDFFLNWFFVDVFLWCGCIGNHFHFWFFIDEFFREVFRNHCRNFFYNIWVGFNDFNSSFNWSRFFNCNSNGLN